LKASNPRNPKKPKNPFIQSLFFIFINVSTTIFKYFFSEPPPISLCLFSFTFGIPVDEDYPIQEQQCDRINADPWFLKNWFR